MSSSASASNKQAMLLSSIDGSLSVKDVKIEEPLTILKQKSQNSNSKLMSAGQRPNTQVIRQSQD